MALTIRQRETLAKVNIGSHYYGPRLDRPALRRMPQGWTLHTNDKPRQWLPSPDKCVAIVVVCAWLFAIAVTMNWIKLS